MRFAGEYQDTESGLYYLRARYFDASTGQFISRVAISSLTLHSYAYVANNPLNATDPTGNFALALALPAVAVPGVIEVLVAAAIVTAAAVTVAYAGYLTYEDVIAPAVA